MASISWAQAAATQAAPTPAASGTSPSIFNQAGQTFKAAASAVSTPSAEAGLIEAATSAAAAVPTGTFSQPTPPVTIHLKLNEPPSLTQAQLFTIYNNLPYYQAHGYPLAAWNQLNPSDQATLKLAGIQPQVAAPAVAASPPVSTTTVVAIVGAGAIGVGALWYFLIR